RMRISAMRISTCLGSRNDVSGFTLIELMIAVMIMALLVTGAALTFARPIQAARWGEAVAIVRSADESNRTFARRFGRDVFLVIDLSEQTFARREGDRITWQRTLPRGMRITQIRAADGT